MFGVNRFTVLDGLVLVAYLGGTTALGLYLGGRQRNARDYFVADQNIPWWGVLFSVVASETSALTFISIPGLSYIGNLGFLQVVAGYILGRIVVAYTLLPRYYDGQLVTAYALLESRFGLTTRRFTSIVFMATRAVADSVRVFATAIPIALIIGPVVPREYVMPAAILVLGVLTVIYTYKGGMRAVVWTEMVQAGVYLLGGLAAIVLLGRAIPGGWSAILSAASQSGKLQVLDWYTGFDRPHTVFAGLLGGGFLAMASHGADQLIVQRLLSSRSLTDAQTRAHRQRIRRLRAVHAVPAHRHRVVSAVRRQDVSGDRCDLPDIHRREHAPGAARVDSRRHSRRHDEHALGRNQLARGRDDARHLSAAQRAPCGRSGDASRSARFSPLSGVSC